MGSEICGYFVANTAGKCAAVSSVRRKFSVSANIYKSLLCKVIRERTMAGLAAARARGRSGGAPYKMTVAKLRLAMAAMGQRETKVADLCKELGITRQTLYRHVTPDGKLRPDGPAIVILSVRFFPFSVVTPYRTRILEFDEGFSDSMKNIPELIVKKGSYIALKRSYVTITPSPG
jgi:transposase-like protein